MKNTSFLPLAAACILLGTRPSSGVEIIGHRGASFDAPENTLTSFKLACEQNADGVELDVYLTKDRRIVVIHDANTGRTSGVTNRIVEQTFDQLRALDVGQWGKWQHKGFSEKIPALEEVLALVPPGKRLFIEIKCGPEILPELSTLLHQASHPAPQAVIIGFDYDTMRQAKLKLPKHSVLWLVAADKITKKYPPVERLIEKAKAANLGGLDLAMGFPIDREFVQKVHQAGLKLYTWTVDDAAVARKQAAAGVDGITTDRPGWLLQQLAAPAVQAD